MLKEIEQRQSIRKYLNKPVEPEKILELLKAAMNAPTARNTQEWKFKVITNSQALNDMTKAIRELNIVVFKIKRVVK